MPSTMPIPAPTRPVAPRTTAEGGEIPLEFKLLTMKQVYALYLTVKCGMTQKKAAKLMKCSRSSISGLIARAKKAINA